MMYREVKGIPGIYIRGSLQALRWVAVKPSLISSRTRTVYDSYSVCDGLVRLDI